MMCRAVGETGYRQGLLVGVDVSLVCGAVGHTGQGSRGREGLLRSPVSTMCGRVKEGRECQGLVLSFWLCGSMGEKGEG